MEMMKRNGYANATEARSSDYDLTEGNTVDGGLSSVLGMRMPFARTRVASVLGFRGAVGMVARGLDWEVRHPWWWCSC